MSELIFSLGEIFDSTSKAGCLSQYSSRFYHIPAYQRGYKWGSGKGGAVTVLLEDLKSAFEKRDSEYYLQYITVKRKQVILAGENVYYLEVIDGQQRLTTLSIILSVLHAFLRDECPDNENIVANKLDYAVRSNFFLDHIYPVDKVLSLSETDWEAFIEANPEFDRQDIYFMHGAVKAARDFLESLTRLSEFYRYILNSVKLIVNSVEPHIASETVFRNLNSNKVPLTETELIKALLITHSGRNQVDQSDSHFREVMEVRAGLGRKWDEIQYWCNSPAIKSFFFKKEGAEPMHELLTLVASLLSGSKPDDSKNEGRWLFAVYTRIDADKAVKEIIKTQQILADWFNNNEFYHLIGFCRFARNSGNNSLKFLRECLQMKTHSALRERLLHEKNRLVFGGDVTGKMQRERLEALSYGDDSDQMQAILLALSVFPPNGVSWRFDFEDFVNNRWSLEHIFPQSPEGKKNKLNEDDKGNIRKLFQDSNIEISILLESYLAKVKRSEEESRYISEQLGNCKAIHGIGNMCLLTGGDNSALGCSFFNVKRKKILELVQHGSFVPKHTFDVFGKMINGLEDNLRRWSLGDMKAHTEYIVDLLCEKENNNESR